MGYPIAGVAQEGEGGAAAEQPIEVYLAKADPAKGQQVFNKCMACHNADKGGANQLGPNLWDVIGEPIGQGKGFAFSDALAKKGGTWNWDNLSQWLTSPKAFAPGHQDDLRRAQQPAGSRRRHRLPQLAQRCAQAASRGARPRLLRRKPGEGPGNGPQKAEKEPVLTEQQTGANPKNIGGEGAPKVAGPRASRPRSRAPRPAHSGGAGLGGGRRQDGRA